MQDQYVRCKVSILQLCYKWQTSMLKGPDKLGSGLNEGGKNNEKKTQ